MTGPFAEHIGWVIFGTLVFYLLSIPFPFLLPVSTFLAWLVPLISWARLAKNARRQALLLLILGVSTLVYAAAHGVSIHWEQALTTNLPLLAMFVAVSFLTLTNSSDGEDALPQGRTAVVATAIGTHLLGAVINLSVLFVFGDRLTRKSLLGKGQLVVLSRSFTAAAWWSPFFIATGVALTYAPEMHWQEAMVPGLLMSAISLVYSSIEVSCLHKGTFVGYPLKGQGMVVPLFLAALVLLIHLQWHQVRVLLLICLFAPVGTLVFMPGRPRISTLADYIANRMVSIASPFALFLAAGVFSTGIQSLTYLYPSLFQLHDTSLSPMLFALISAAMILVGIAGVHPVISISIVSPLLLPLEPDHSQLGFLFLTSWAISTCSSPLSGVGLVMVSRFQVEPKTIIRSNLLYAVAMWAIATQMNIFFFTM